MITFSDSCPKKKKFTNSHFRQIKVLMLTADINKRGVIYVHYKNSHFGPNKQN